MQFYVNIKILPEDVIQEFDWHGRFRAEVWQYYFMDGYENLLSEMIGIYYLYQVY